MPARRPPRPVPTDVLTAEHVDAEYTRAHAYASTTAIHTAEREAFVHAVTAGTPALGALLFARWYVGANRGSVSPCPAAVADGWAAFEPHMAECACGAHILDGDAMADPDGRPLCETCHAVRHPDLGCTCPDPYRCTC